MDWHDIASSQVSSIVRVEPVADCKEIGLSGWSSMFVDFLHGLVLGGRLTASGSPLLQVILLLADIMKFYRVYEIMHELLEFLYPGYYS